MGGHLISQKFRETRTRWTTHNPPAFRERDLRMTAFYDETFRCSVRDPCSRGKTHQRYAPNGSRSTPLKSVLELEKQCSSSQELTWPQRALRVFLSQLLSL